MKKIFFVGLLMITSLSSYAQYYYDRSKVKAKTFQDETNDYTKYISASWDLNIPLSNTQFINSTSSAGIRLSYRKKLNDVDNLWAGFEFGAASYSQYYSYQTYFSPSSATSSDFYNYVSTYSLACSIDYFFLPMERKIAPYLGFSIGAASTNFSQYYNVNKVNNNSWGVQLRPELGVVASFKTNSSWKIKASAHYDYASNSSALEKNNFLLLRGSEYENFMSAGFSVGIVKMIR
jgi:hypothetical protein